MNTRKAVVGAAAAVVAAVGGVGTAGTATAQGHERITSIEQLKTHLHHAVVVESQTLSALGCCPAGAFASEPTI